MSSGIQRKWEGGFSELNSLSRTSVLCGGEGEWVGVGPDAWLAQPVERATLDPGVMSSNPTLGAELTLKKKSQFCTLG